MVQTLATDNESILKSQTDTEVESIVGACDAPGSSTVPFPPPNIKLEMYNQLLEANTSAEHTDDNRNRSPAFELTFICEQCDFR